MARNDAASPTTSRAPGTWFEVVYFDLAAGAVYTAQCTDARGSGCTVDSGVADTVGHKDISDYGVSQ